MIKLLTKVSSVKLPARWSHSHHLFQQQCSRDNLLPLNPHTNWGGMNGSISCSIPNTAKKEDTSSFLPDNCLYKIFVNIGGTLVQGLGSVGGFPFSSAVRFCCKSHLEEPGVNCAAYVITAGQNINTSRSRAHRMCATATHNRLEFKQRQRV